MKSLVGLIVGLLLAAGTAQRSAGQSVADPPIQAQGGNIQPAVWMTPPQCSRGTTTPP